MKLRFFVFLLTGLFAGCSTQSTIPKSDVVPLVYEVDLTDRADDLFKVRLRVNDLAAENAVYQFASTAPGTYVVMDIGRYVRSFCALDAGMDTVKTEQISVNQWQISDPARVSEIHYSVAETWDTPVDSNRIMEMTGTSIEADFVLINGQGVFGYPTGMQSRPLRIKLVYPETWELGTALPESKGFYWAEDFDHVVDSPILMGRVSKADMKVRGSKVDIFVYSKTDQVHADDILNSMKDILKASADFMDGLPVKRYTFLYVFEDITIGAWEHHYSSTYVYRESDFQQIRHTLMPSVAAHEFFHVVTPLNIHSEIIETFNFVEPVPSEHLWLYEGTTEWAANITLLRAGLMTLDRYLAVTTQKLNVADRFDPHYSLSQLSLTSYSKEGQRQYINIYQKGAVISALLDIRLLELSSGKRGLREVINELAKQYGPDRPFKEETFFDTFTQMTYPEIGDFFDRYVKKAEPLPLEEYFGKIGIEYVAEYSTGEQKPTIGMHLGFEDGQIAIVKVDDAAAALGFAPKDVLLALNEEEISLETAQVVLSKLRDLNPGDSYEMSVSRNGEKMNITGQILTKEDIKRHQLIVKPEPDEKALKLREAWMKNL